MPLRRTRKPTESDGMNIPFNPMPDGTCRTIKEQYHKNSLANFTRGGVFAATGVAVVQDMEEPAERRGVRPGGCQSDDNDRRPWRMPTEDSGI